MRLHPSHAAMAGAMLLALAAPCLIHPQSTNDSSQREIPVLQSTCLISADVRRLVEFYEPVLTRKANWSGVDYAEFPTRAGVLAIFSAADQAKYIPGWPNQQRIAASFWNSKLRTSMPNTGVFSHW